MLMVEERHFDLGRRYVVPFGSVCIAQAIVESYISIFVLRIVSTENRGTFDAVN